MNLAGMKLTGASSPETTSTALSSSRTTLLWAWYVQHHSLVCVLLHFILIMQMLIALFGYMDGYQANIPFLKPGEKFLDDSYMGMRMVRITSA